MIQQNKTGLLHNAMTEISAPIDEIIAHIVWQIDSFQYNSVLRVS